MEKKGVIKLSGLFVALFATFALLSSLSYLFTWRADQSVIADSELVEPVMDVANAAGQRGAGLGWLLVARWFGLGSFALIVALFIVAIRMIFGKREFPVIKTVILAITASVVISLLMAFFSEILGLKNAFGGGLGGDCGCYVVSWFISQFGKLITFLTLLVIIAMWLYFASRRFSNWFMNLGNGNLPEFKLKRKKSAVETAVENIEPVNEEEEDEDEEELDQSEEEMPKPQVLDPVEPVVPLVSPAVVPALKPEEQEKTETQKKPEEQAKPEISKTVEQKLPAGEIDLNNEGLEVIDGEELSTDVIEELPRIDVRDELKNFRFPPLELLEDYEDQKHDVSQEELKRNNYKIRATLKTYKIDVDNVKAVVGPTVTLYKVYPAPGVKISAIMNLQADIAMALHAKGVRMETLADSVGIEVANDQSSIVPLKALLNDSSFRDSDAELPVAIGYNIQQKVKVFDLADAPHLLVAGATKQGKSVGLNVLITSLLYAKHPSELKFVFIDPKMVEFSAYARLLKHYLAILPDAVSDADEFNNAICKTAKSAEQTLRSLCIEMDARYELMGKALVNKVTLYNQKYTDRVLLPTEGHRYMPYLVVVVDEYADLTMSVGGSGDAKAQARSITTSIIRLAQKGRAAGIHVVLATQRPSVDVVTGTIKMNFPTRIAFRVFSSVDSKTILDSPGAEKLIGRGDMIYYAGVDKERVQCAYISNEEINTLTEFIGDQKGYMKSYNTPYYLPAPEPDQAEEGTAMIDMKHLDERFEEAARQVVMTQKGSTSDIQRRLGMGYAKAGRVMDQLEAAGIVGPQEGSKPRQVLVSDLNELEGIISAFRNA